MELLPNFQQYKTEIEWLKLNRNNFIDESNIKFVVQAIVADRIGYKPILCDNCLIFDNQATNLTEEYMLEQLSQLNIHKYLTETKWSIQVDHSTFRLVTI